MKSICIAGKNEIACEALEWLLRNLDLSENNVIALPTVNDSGVDGWQPSLKKLASLNNIRIVKLEDLYSISDLIFLSLEFDRVIKPERFLTNQLFNIHFSLLPAYKGVYTSIFPIINGEKYSGVTLHKIDSGIDTGDIILQKKFRLKMEYTARQLYSKYNQMAIKLFKESIILLLSRNYTVSEQSPIGSSYYSRGSIDLNHTELSLNKSGYQIYNYLRALIFPEYQLPQLDGKKIYKVVFLGKIRKGKGLINNAMEKKFIITGIDSSSLEAHYK